MLKIEFRAMGCQMGATLDTDDPQAQPALDEIPRQFEAWEQCLSRFRDTSELVGLNRRGGRPVRVSETLWQVIRLALQAAAESDGLVTPLVLDALETAGYAWSMSEPLPVSALASFDGLPDASPGVADWRAVRLDRRRREVRLERGVRLDLAGVAKGWAADQAARQLGRIAPAMVDASGDLAFSGPRTDGSGWPIEIENPFGQSDDLPLLILSNAAVATSSRGYRRWQKAGRWQHHIIDPRTGLPAETDVFAATVVAPSAAQAEIGAKVAFILGSRKGLQWIETKPHLAALLILEDGRVKTSQRFSEFCWG